MYKKYESVCIAFYIVRVMERFPEFLSSGFSSGNIKNSEIHRQDMNARKEEVSTITELPKVDVKRLVNEATRVCARKYTELNRAQSMPYLIVNSWIEDTAFKLYRKSTAFWITYSSLGSLWAFTPIYITIMELWNHLIGQDQVNVQDNTKHWRQCKYNVYIGLEIDQSNRDGIDETRPEVERLIWEVINQISFQNN